MRRFFAIAQHGRCISIFPAIILSITFAFFASSTALRAGTISVEKDDGRFVVDVHDAPIDEVLERLGEAAGFDVERPGDPSDVVVSGRFHGTLGRVIGTMLQNENYLILHSPASKGGIALVQLLGSVGPAIQTADATPTAAGVTPSTVSPANMPMPIPLPREVIAPIAPAAPVVPTRRARG
jgi:hypothetical protein